MARRVEGTVTAGFVCDSVGCGENAVYAVVFAIPYLNEPRRPPIVQFTDVHVCPHHWKSVHRNVQITEPMREAARTVADQNGGRPDFDRAYIVRIAVHDPEYHSFQEAAGLIAKGDAMAKTPLIIKG